jgi:hypothetical protein
VKSKRPRSFQLFRYAVQVIVAAYVLAIVIANTVGSSWAANLHTICPFGGVANLYTYFSDGGYVAKLHSAVFVMLLALVIGLVLTGKAFCGWICPLGSVQQALGWIGQRLWPRAYNKVPRWLERILHCLKWVVLVWVLVQTARTGRLVFQDWDPYYNLYRIWTDQIALTGYVVTGVTLLLSLFIHLQLILLHRYRARRHDLYRLRSLLESLPGEHRHLRRHDDPELGMHALPQVRGCLPSEFEGRGHAETPHVVQWALGLHLGLRRHRHSGLRVAHPHNQPDR